MSVSIRLTRLSTVLNVIVLLSISCEHKREATVERIYYPNDNLKIEQTKKNGQLDGVSNEYYSDGRLKTVSHWRAGKLNGQMLTYHTNGILWTKSTMLADSLDGYSIQYCRDGRKKQVSLYAVGRKINAIDFDSATKKIKERRLFTKTGRLFFVSYYDKKGKQFFNSLLPLIDAPDTITLGSKYTGCVSFGYHLSGELMIIGRLVEKRKSIDRFQIIDTIAVIRPDVQERFCFSYKPRPIKGKNVFAYKFIQSGVHTDSLSINYLSGSHPFFVK